MQPEYKFGDSAPKCSFPFWLCMKEILKYFKSHQSVHPHWFLLQDLLREPISGITSLQEVNLCWSNPTWKQLSQREHARGPPDAPWFPAGRNLLSEQTHSSWRHRSSRDGGKPRHQLGPRDWVDLREEREKRETTSSWKCQGNCNFLRGEEALEEKLLSYKPPSSLN